MHTTTRAARGRGHLSRHERQRLDRAEAFSRRTSLAAMPVAAVKLATKDLELIDRLVRRDRTAVSTSSLAIAGIGASELCRQAVLSRISESARCALADGEITASRAEQIARHVRRALGRVDRVVVA
jgi:hypothetical protein